MRHFPKWLTLIVLAMIAIVTIFVYSSQSFRYNDIISTMNEIVRIVSIESIDKSSRVNEGMVILDKEKFEADFKSEFQTNIKMNVEEYYFDYLEADNGHLKALKVKIKDEEGTFYQVVYSSDVKE